MDSLKTLLSIDDVLSEVLNPHFTDCLSDFCDGSRYQEHPLFSTDNKALQIVGYYDELEVVNPIGSYVSKQKLGCLFFFLGNIRPQFRSTLKAINLLAVGKVVDIKQYGIDKFFSPFVEDLKNLYCDGVVVETSGGRQTFFGGLLAFLADNLAAHAVAGFKESMSFALRVCRSCMVTSEQVSQILNESQCVLRDPESHHDQCQLLCGNDATSNSTFYGINRRSILEDVPGFSVTTCLPHDILHDLFEGVVPYELKLFIQHSAWKKYFSVSVLNDRLSRFDFDQDKPSFLDDRHLKSGTKTRQSASQMISLCLSFPLLVGDLIPLEDEHWTSFLQLLRICKIALSPVCTLDTAMYLRVLIEEKISTFPQLYPQSNVIPKFHYMIHYASQIETFGPLIHSWTMRQEAKLSFFKRASRNSNKKNVCKTVAKKHQLWQCYAFLNKFQVFHTNPEVSPKSVYLELELESQYIKAEILRLFPTISLNETLNHPNWVKHHSCTYRKGHFIMLSYDIMAPKFGKVVDIIIHNEVIVFLLEVYVTDFFENHYNAYCIKTTHTFCAIPLLSLNYYHPLQGKYSFVSSDLHLYIISTFLF